MKASQDLLVQRELAKGKHLTQLQALRHFGVGRLAARVHRLRERGWDIRTRIIKTAGGARVASYHMVRA